MYFFVTCSQHAEHFIINFLYCNFFYHKKCILTTAILTKHGKKYLVKNNYSQCMACRIHYSMIWSVSAKVGTIFLKSRFASISGVFRSVFTRSYIINDHILKRYLVNMWVRSFLTRYISWLYAISNMTSIASDLFLTGKASLL